MIDMFVHPALESNEADLFDLSNFNWHRWLEVTVAEMDRHGIAASGVCVMDDGILDREADLNILREAAASGRFWFNWMPDLRQANALQRVQLAAEAGFRSLAFHSYLQKIRSEDYELVASLAMAGEKAGLFNGFCSAYGSKRMFDYCSLPLVAALMDRLTGPVFLYHAGGARVLEAMLMCEMWPQLYLETSFSLGYWRGSSVDGDLAFSLRKLGASRVLFGSDAPFMPLSIALKDHRDFFAQHDVSSADQNLVLGGNARRLLRFLKS
ncbi:MAG: hypothetical protein JWO08_3874 [Verrucomicrobiaceae bacterium]|nr:hypothetical protein [Verrucomicrobiaceae bacterium]